MCVSAVCGDFGHGFGNEEANRELIERSKRVMDITMHFETNIVTTHIKRYKNLKSLYPNCLLRWAIRHTQQKRLEISV